MEVFVCPGWLRLQHLDTLYLYTQTETLRQTQRPCVQHVDCSGTAACSGGLFERRDNSLANQTVLVRSAPLWGPGRCSCSPTRVEREARAECCTCDWVCGSVGPHTVCQLCEFHGSTFAKSWFSPFPPPRYAAVRSLCFWCISADRHNHSPLSKGFFPHLTLQLCKSIFVTQPSVAVMWKGLFEERNQSGVLESRPSGLAPESVTLLLPHLIL